MYNPVFSRAFAPGFNINPADDVPGFDGRTAWFNGMRPGLVTPQNPDAEDEVPGFRVMPQDGVPGFDVRPDEAPGFRVANDGSAEANQRAVERPSVQGPGRLAGPRYVNTSGNRTGFLDRLNPYLSDVGDAAAYAWQGANAAVNGAYSVFPGTYNALRALARGVGLLGPEEFRRFGQEADFIGGSLGQIVRHPGPAYRAGRAAFVAAYNDPLLPWYIAGRTAMGLGSRLGPAAAMGDALRAVENGHNLLDAILYHGVQGIPSSGR